MKKRLIHKKKRNLMSLNWKFLFLKIEIYVKFKLSALCFVIYALLRSTMPFLRVGTIIIMFNILFVLAISARKREVKQSKIDIRFFCLTA